MSNNQGGNGFKQYMSVVHQKNRVLMFWQRIWIKMAISSWMDMSPICQIKKRNIFLWKITVDKRNEIDKFILGGLETTFQALHNRKIPIVVSTFV